MIGFSKISGWTVEDVSITPVGAALVFEFGTISVKDPSGNGHVLYYKAGGMGPSLHLPKRVKATRTNPNTIWKGNYKIYISDNLNRELTFDDLCGACAVLESSFFGLSGSFLATHVRRERGKHWYASATAVIAGGQLAVLQIGGGVAVTFGSLSANFV